MHVHQFFWAWPFRFRRYCYFQNWLNFPFGPWTTTAYGSQKFESNRIDSQVEVDVVCMYTNFCGHGLSGFGDIATFQNWPNFPFRPDL